MKRLWARSIAAAVAVAGAALTVTGIAVAGSATSVYAGNGGTIQAAVQSGPTVKSSGSLPFTGLNLTLAVLLAVGLLAAGLWMRRRGSAAA